MLTSGTHTPGVPPELFETNLPTALRFERPDPRLADYVTDYHAFDSGGVLALGVVDWGMPGGANIRLFLGDRPVNATIANRIYAPTPIAALFGPTGRAIRIEAFGGLTIGLGVSPIGWARLFSHPANRLRDRIVPLAEVAGAPLAQGLMNRLRASDRSAEIKAVIDAFLLEHLGPPHPDEPLVRKLMAHIADEATDDIAAIADDIGVTAQQLRQLALYHFGFPPKRLLRRARFLRSLVRMYAAGEGADYSLISKSYFDVSHFLRDSEEFLGMTPRRFMAMQTPYLRQILRVRQAVLGAPVQALHQLG